MAKRIPVGIDLGTTVSAAAYLSAPGQSTMVRSAEGNILVPSLVFFSEEQVVVGDDAKTLAAEHPEAVAECAKRDIGEEFYHRQINGKQMPPEVVLSYILQKLKRDITAEIGELFSAVITVPAYFDEPRRKRTADAAEIADLPILGIVNEPTAAALAFGEQLGYLATRGVPREEMNLLVYDLGGGTFDVTVVHLEPNDVRTLAIDGDVKLGGRDWDERIVARYAEEFIDRHGVDPRQADGTTVYLGQLAEQAKHNLSRRHKTALSAKFARRSLKIKLTREDFEEMTVDLLERTKFSTKKVLQDAGLGFEAISRILLVGGSTRMPMVAEMLEDMSGITPDHIVNPDEAVARGAALYAGYVLSAGVKSNGYHVTDVSAHRLGVEGVDPDSRRRRAAAVIPKNTELPAFRTRRFVTKDKGQQSVFIKVLEGDSDHPDECTVVGKTVLHGLPPDLDAEHPVDVEFSYDKDGRLSVVARLPNTDCEIGVEFQRESGLSPTGLNHWRNVIAQNGKPSEPPEAADKLS